MGQQTTHLRLGIEPTAFDPKGWNTMLASLPGAHVLQTWEWGQVKTAYGWKALPYTWQDGRGQVVAAALILQRSLSIAGLPTGLRVLYVPKGPVFDWNNASLRPRILNELAVLARQQGATFIKIDPDVRLGTGEPGLPGAQENPVGQQVQWELISSGWRFSDEQIQFRNTVLVDLRPDEGALLANMKPKTRYNIRLAGRKGVVVRKGSQADFDILYRMYAETSLRDCFVIRTQAYYFRVWSIFMKAGMADVLIAEVGKEVVAAVFVFRFAQKAWYLYGMSSQAHREKMPSHLLQWEAIRLARAAGCTVYDLWGAPDVFDESDPLWGVYRFKSGLGGQVVRTLGAWDLPLRPTIYRLYTHTLPRLLDWMRRRGKERTRRLMG